MKQAGKSKIIILHYDASIGENNQHWDRLGGIFLPQHNVSRGITSKIFIYPYARNSLMQYLPPHYHCILQI